MYIYISCWFLLYICMLTAIMQKKTWTRIVGPSDLPKAAQIDRFLVGCLQRSREFIVLRLTTGGDFHRDYPYHPLWMVHFRRDMRKSDHPSWYIPYISCEIRVKMSKAILKPAWFRGYPPWLRKAPRLQVLAPRPSMLLPNSRPSSDPDDLLGIHPTWLKRSVWHSLT